MIYYALVYLLMFSSLIFSDIIFVIGILGLGHVTLGGFSSLLWEMAIMLFVLNVAITLSVERNEFNLNNILLTFVMLFTYAKNVGSGCSQWYDSGNPGCALSKRSCMG